MTSLRMLEIVNSVEIAILAGCIVFNLLITRRVRRESRALGELNHTYVPRMLAAMEDMTYAICPLCALAAGKGTVTSAEVFDINDRKVAKGDFFPEPEENGEHVIRVTGMPCEGKTRCLAVEIRRRCRELFEESMKGDFVMASGKRRA